MFRAKNWGSFQSYKDRNPPWIRLHKRLIDDINFQKMSVEARALLPMIWLLISEDEEPSSGMLRIGYEEITFRLRICHKNVKVVLDEIVKAGFLERVGAEEEFSTTEKTQAETICYGTVTETLQNCHSETETETETKTKTETKRRGAKKKNGVEKPSDVSETIWIDFINHRKAKKAPVSETVINSIRKEADKIPWSMDQALSEICARGWQGFKADWILRDKDGGNKIHMSKSMQNLKEIAENGW